MASRSNAREIDARPERVIVGRVRRAHGLRGEVAVEIESDVEARFAEGAEMWLAPSSGAAPKRVRVASRRPFKGGCLIRFDGCDDRDAAEAVGGARLEVDRSEVPPAAAGSWYYFELIGCQCHAADHGLLGRVEDVIEDGGGLLLKIAAASGGEILIPFVNAFLAAVDVAAGRIDLRLPPGLIETCTSPR